MRTVMVGMKEVTYDSTFYCSGCGEYYLESIKKDGSCPMCDCTGKSHLSTTEFVVKVSERVPSPCYHCGNPMGYRPIGDANFALACVNCSLRTPSFKPISDLFFWWENCVRINRGR